MRPLRPTSALRCFQQLGHRSSRILRPTSPNARKSLARQHRHALTEAERHLENSGFALLRQAQDTATESGTGPIVDTDDESEWDACKIPDLYERLERNARAGQYNATVALAEYMVRGRRQRPDRRLYASLVLCNIDHEFGSVESVKKLLQEIVDDGIHLDSVLCHNTLKVLSVHSDHILRANIIEHMRASWFVISEQGQHDLIVGWLREGSLEMALNALAKLRDTGAVIPEWLQELCTRFAMHAGDLSVYLESETRLAHQLRHDALDMASELHRHVAITHIWEREVRSGEVRPSSGTCLQVLASAAQHGDVELANDVFRRLGERGFIFSAREYGLLSSAYLSTRPPLLHRALSTFSLMAENGVDADASVFRPLYQHLADHPDEAEQVDRLMQAMQQKGRFIPLTLVNTVLEVHAAKKDVKRAMSLFQSMHMFERRVGPKFPRTTFADTTTFEILYDLAARAEDEGSDMAILLREEQARLKIESTAPMLDSLIYTFARHSDWPALKDLVTAVVKGGPLPGLRSAQTAVDALARQKDHLCWDLMKLYPGRPAERDAWDRHVHQSREGGDQRGDDGTVVPEMLTAGDHQKRCQ